MIDGQLVSLLVSSRNRPQLLIEAVESVLAGSTLPDEIVVVDQSDVANETLAGLSMPGTVVQYIKADTIGLSRSRNTALEHASNPIVVMIDDDCLVAEDWLETIVRALLRAGPKSVVTGRVLAGEQEESGAFAPSLHTSDEPAEFRGRGTTDPLATFNLAFRLTTYSHVGPFDPRLGPGTRFPSSEDNDYGYRLLMAGYTIVFEPAAVVYHRAWRTRVGYVALRYAYGRGQGGYYAKYLAARDSYMLWKLMHALKRRGKRMLESDRKGVTGEFAWMAGWAAGAAEWLIQYSRRGRT